MIAYKYSEHCPTASYQASLSSYSITNLLIHPALWRTTFCDALLSVTHNFLWRTTFCDALLSVTHYFLGRTTFWDTLLSVKSSALQWSFHYREKNIHISFWPFLSAWARTTTLEEILTLNTSVISMRPSSSVSSTCRTFCILTSSGTFCRRFNESRTSFVLIKFPLKNKKRREDNYMHRE